MNFELGKDFNMLKQKVNDIGQEMACKVICADIDEGKFQPEEYSIKDMAEAMDTSHFPKATSALINKKLISAYNAFPGIGGQLCTTVPSNKQTETVVGFGEVDTPDVVSEGMPYGETGYGEKYVTATNYKYGRLISITEETIKFDQTGQILMRAKSIGEKAALRKEQLIVQGVIDSNSTVYKPTNLAQALYSTTRTNGVNAATTAFGEAGLKAIDNLVDEMNDDNGDPVFIMPGGMSLLVPSELKMEAWQLMNSVNTPESAENAKNYYNGRYPLLTSPFLTSASLYWVGDFKQDFWWLEVYPLQLMTRNMTDTDEGFKRDIIAQFKTRFFGAIMAVDFRHSFRGGT